MGRASVDTNRARLRLRRLAARARLFAHVIGDLGLPMLGQVIVNSARNEMASRNRNRNPDRGTSGSAGSIDERAGSPPGALVSVDVRSSGALFVFEHAELEASFRAPDVVRLSWGPGVEPVHYALAEVAWPDPSVAIVEGRGHWRILSDVLELRVSDVGEATLSRRDGTVLRGFAAPTRRDGAWEQVSQMRQGELFTGLGEQAGGVDLRGGTYRLWNTDAGGAWGPGASRLYMGIPLVLGAHPECSLLTFYENPTRGRFTFGDTRVRGSDPQGMTVQFAGGQLRTYLIAGSPQHLMGRFSELTGRPAMPPRWAFGYHQSRWGYKKEADVRYVLRGYLREGLPLSAIHLDIDYMDGYRVFTVDKRRFPNMRALSEELSRSEVALVSIVDPGVKVDARYQIYREAESRDLFCRDEKGRIVEGVVWPGRAAFPDFTDPRTRSWWAGKYRALAEEGVSGVWHDMNEPASMSLRGDPTLPLSTRHALDGRGGDHGEAHNLYGLLMNRSGFEGLTDARPERRPFIVSRSGWASNQRWAWNWTGDADSTWEAMRQQIATMVGLGMSGVAFSGSDIGGFSGVPDDELYLRWLQMSVFMAFCRTHSVVGAPPREPWRFDEPTRSRIGEWIRFRYRLLPYLYTLAHEATRTGVPPVRPLWWSTGGDGCGRSMDEEFLLGDSLLVAPVCEAGAARKSVVFPPGSWKGLFEHSFFHSSDKWRESAPLSVAGGRMPVFVREGRILALDDGFAHGSVHGSVHRSATCAVEGDDALGGEVAPSTTPLPGHAPRLLSFHCWPDAAGRAVGTCYDDEGDGDGARRFDELRLEGASEGDSASLDWRRTGDHPVHSPVRVVLHGFEAASVTKDGERVGPTNGGAIQVAPFDRLELRDLREIRGASPREASRPGGS